MIGTSLWLLAAAFWTGHWLLGVRALNLATLVKVAFGVTFDGAPGWAALAPAVTTLARCDAVFAAAHVRRRRRRRPSARSDDGR